MIIETIYIRRIKKMNEKQRAAYLKMTEEDLLIKVKREIQEF